MIDHNDFAAASSRLELQPELLFERAEDRRRGCSARRTGSSPPAGQCDASGGGPLTPPQRPRGERLTTAGPSGCESSGGC
jgi:hypothetical protein